MRNGICRFYGGETFALAKTVFDEYAVNAGVSGTKNIGGVVADHYGVLGSGAGKL